MGWNIRNLTPSFGVEISGLDLSEDLENAEFDKLREIWNAADGVILLRDQKLVPQQLLAIAKRFGDIYIHHKAPPSEKTSADANAVMQFCGMSASGSEAISAPSGSIVLKGGIGWHSEHSNEATPPSVTISRIDDISLPAGSGPVGGDMLFANQYLAYEALSEPIKTLLEPLKAVHRLPEDAPSFNVGPDSGGGEKETSLHPIVRTHPETGRKALFVNQEFTSRIEGLSKAESDAMLGFLFAHSTSHEFIYRHSWQSDEMIIFDNRTVLHYLDSSYAEGGYRVSQLVMSVAETPL